MAGNKKISELPLAGSIDATAYLPIVDPTEVAVVDQNKRVTFAQLDTRYIALSQFPILFSSELATKTTDNVAEGAINKYYTEARVAANVEVTENTSNRHFALSKTVETEYATLDTVNQILDIRNSDHLENGLISKEDWSNFHSKQDKLSPADTSTGGFLSKSDWNVFDRKVSKSLYDQDEGSFATVNNSPSIIDIPDLIFDPANVFSFHIMMTVLVKVTLGSDKYRTLSLKGVSTDTDGMIIMSTVDQDAIAFGNLSNFYFFCNPITGQVSYDSGATPDFLSSEIKYRVWTTTV
jgi:hypothetical protein